MLALVYVALVSYVVGSFPSAYLAGKYLGGVDIRTLGDGNAGTANAWKSLGPWAGGLVFMMDVGKGAAAVSMARALGTEETGIMVAGAAAIAGHNWPVFLHFHGGRGAATAMGVLAAVMPLLVLPLMLLSLASVRFTRNSTAGVAVVFVPLPLVAWYAGVSWQMITFAIGLMLFVGVSHYISERLWRPQGPVSPEKASRRV